MTTAFYAPPEQFRGRRVVLPPNETRHAVRALRHSPGDEVVVVDGTGGWHRVRLEHTGQKQALGTVVASARNVGEPKAPCVLAAGVLHKRSRYETLVEKAVELGVTTIVPLATMRAERTDVRYDRLRNLMIAATKQCGRSRVPHLTAPCSLADVLVRFPRLTAFCCHESGAGRSALPAALQLIPSSTGVLLTIGPEGGFAPHEVATAQRAGAQLVHLGPRRLRAETAALTAAGAVSLHRAA
ncbi:16S rRNA methyltransferase [Longimonas halophila]|uniref:Ribosomal RNA small subunit methyltransferase E n=1 Tax=Longimonas halophila TaxID=1469170 RepID=A0A2H3P202_9BACT|nr:RsmE family RNA methyltransferase [Longimonas halophila]PEN05030.1 16S rRNA methyltransferase [Longimonas halophila]